MWQIAETIVTELRTMIDYHNARVYLLADDHRTLEPIAFAGLAEYAGETFDALRCEMGRAITGTAAQRGQTLCIGDAQHCEFAQDIEGSADIDESILAVPLRYERRTIGVIVLSKLGLDQFSTLAVRLLELLAAQAAVAFEKSGCWRPSDARWRSPRRCSRSPRSQPPIPRCPPSPLTSPARLVT